MITRQTLLIRLGPASLLIFAASNVQRSVTVDNAQNDDIYATRNSVNDLLTAKSAV